MYKKINLLLCVVAGIILLNSCRSRTQWQDNLRAPIRQPSASPIEPELTQKQNELSEEQSRRDLEENLDQGRDETSSNCLKTASYDFTVSGPYQVATGRVGMVNTYTPTNLPSGCKAPVIHFNNGTGATCGFYTSINTHLASHGFVVGCYESTETGSGDECVAAINTLMSQFSAIADRTKIGTTGHSQGGAAAITCLYQGESRWPNSQLTAHAIQPAHGMNRDGWQSEYPQINSPIFMFSGSDDTVVSDEWVAWGFNQLNTTTYWYQANGATHFNPHNWAKSSGVAWFRWQLLGDAKAGSTLQSYLNSQYWSSIGSK
ncbi:MAG: hypothetical protein CMP10_18440 [Zetaproteobacteria bacterium]|nr:hypothetical protein [Pseudobdellovibrionaceae bacterium]